MASPQDLIDKLIELTVQDKIIWEKTVLNIHGAEHEGFHFCTELLQDEQPGSRNE